MSKQRIFGAFCASILFCCSTAIAMVGTGDDPPAATDPAALALADDQAMHGQHRAVPAGLGHAAFLLSCGIAGIFLLRKANNG